MIVNIKDKKLKKAVKNDNYSSFGQMQDAVMLVIHTLEHATSLQECCLEGHRLHPYERSKNDQHKTYSLDISGKNRITFQFYDGHVHNVDIEDPH